MRIGVALVLLVDILRRSQDLQAYYTDSGFLPRSLLLEHWNPAWLCFHLLSGSAAFASLLFALNFLVAGGLLIGYRTRWCTFACYLFALSLHNRNAFVLDQGDRLLVLLLFWGLFLPWGARWSYDQKRAPQDFGSSDHFLSMGGAAYIFQILTMYWLAGILKLHPIWYSERSACLRSMKLEFLATPLGLELIHFPGLLELLTLAVLVLELLGPLLLLAGNNRLRLLGVALFSAFHMGLWFVLDLEAFSLVCVAALLGLLPSGTWSSAAKSGPPDPGLAWSTRRATALLAAAAMVLVTWWNASIVTNDGKPPQSFFSGRHPLAQAVSALRLVQYWDLFAPYPQTQNVWYLVEAELSDGTFVDLWRGGQAFALDKPSRGSEEFRSQRHRMYMTSLESRVPDSFRKQYLQCLARDWNQQHPNNKVQWLQLVVMRETIGIKSNSEPYRVNLSPKVRATKD